MVSFSHLMDQIFAAGPSARDLSMRLRAISLTWPPDFHQRGLESGPIEGRTVKRTRFTEEQIIAVLNKAEAGAKTGDLAVRRPL